MNSINDRASPRVRVNLRGGSNGEEESSPQPRGRCKHEDHRAIAAQTSESHAMDANSGGTHLI